MPSITRFLSQSSPIIRLVSQPVLHPGKAAYVEDKITVSAAVTGGKPDYTYEYFYQKGTAAAEPLDPDPANSAKAVFIPNDPEAIS